MQISTKFSLLVLLLFVLTQVVHAQTIDDPVEITVMTPEKTVSSKHSSYALIQFKIPNGLWMGVGTKDSRTPPRTIIVPKAIPGFRFEAPQYPEGVEAWVAAKLGRTTVYKETVNVIVPFSVDANVPKQDYDLTFNITFTPSYSAGKLSTHVRKEHSTKVTVAGSSNKVTVPQPSLEPNAMSIVVVPKTTYEGVPGGLKWLFKPLNEENAIVKGLHKLWLDKPGHGKSTRLLPFPSSAVSNITGSSAGVGAAVFNSTREGTMTGSVSLSVFDNNLIGSGLTVTAISCPGAYFNYQFAASFGEESYRDITFKHENFTVADSKYGYDISFRSREEPRLRFNGLGNETIEEDETAYRQTMLHAGLDLYSVSVQSFRFGVGISYDDYDPVEQSFDEILVEEDDLIFLQDADFFPGLLGVGGATITGFKANFIYDHKDQEFASAKGFYAKMTISQNTISDTGEPGNADNYAELKLDVSQYFSTPSQKLVGLMRGGLNLKSEDNIPFYALSSIGGPNSMRAYDFNRFQGQHSFFASGEMRYTLFSPTVLGYPFDIEMAGFLDVGQVFGGDGDVDFGDDLKVDPGFGVRMINKPNIGVIFNIAFGDDGAYFTGGIGLPF